MDNIRIKENENEIVIKKGWIDKKYIMLYFLFTIIIFAIYILQKRSWTNIYVIYFIRFSLVFFNLLRINKDIRKNFILESITINLKHKKIMIKTHSKKKNLEFNQIHDINVSLIPKRSQKSIKDQYSLEIVTNEKKSCYFWGFALSNNKSQEIKEKMLKAIGKGEEI